MLIFALGALGAMLTLRSDSDSVYASRRVRELVEHCAVANASPPAELRGFRARTETELSILVRDTLDREHVTQIEQLAADADWQRSVGYAVHVVGFRSRSVGVPLSALSFVRGWTVPLLYGNELRLGIDGPRRREAARGTDSRAGGDTLRAVHPFAPDRERYYRFSGGDTVAVLHTPARAVPIVRIEVVPRVDRMTGVAAFRGELDVDADRGVVVRMRGQLVYPNLARRGGIRALAARASGLVSAAYMEFVMEEVGGRYWLPVFERTEVQASAETFGPDRSVLRVITRFRDFHLDTAAANGAIEGPVPLTPRVSFAPTDSMNRFHAWRQELGSATARVRASEFDDLAPNAWRASGPPKFSVAPRRIGEVLRYDRVEGAFTGAMAELRFRDAAPGLTARAWGGWAWTERTARGGAALTLARGGWTWGLRSERSLASTNDFRRALEGGTSLSALLASVDNADYVDRRTAAVSVVREIGSTDRSLVTGEMGLGDDRLEVSRLHRGPFGGSTTFLPNRGASPGRYARAAVDLELHPNVSGDFVGAGFGGRAHVEYGRGELNWLRTELATSARAYWGDLWLAAHGAAGLVLGRTIPPQQLFELGGTEGLPGYGYKEFGGDRAALARFATGYNLPLLRSPRRFYRGYFLPGLTPGIAAGVQGGWAEASTPAARRALGLLGRRGSTPDAPPLSLPTAGVRATADVRLTLFSGAASIGAARPVDHRGPWRLVFSLAAAY